MTATRWVPSRKAALVELIDRGALSLAEAHNRHDLSVEELTEWKRALAAHGVPGLRTTRLQIYKQTSAMADKRAARARTAEEMAPGPMKAAASSRVLDWQGSK